MSAQTDLGRLTVSDFVDRIRGEMIPLSSRFSYFSTSLSLGDDDIREYLQDPIAALPPAVVGMIPPVAVLLVPYLERPNGKERRGKPPDDFICFEKPVENRICWESRLESENQELLAFAVKDQEMVDYHYRLFGQLARLTNEFSGPEEINGYFGLVREELGAGVHGEVDEQGWRLKQALLRRQSGRRETKLYREYAHQSMVDTLTLYLHGICCDIDVETGPRQLPSRYLRKRLQLLHSLYPPPDGYAVFPENISQ